MHRICTIVLLLLIDQSLACTAPSFTNITVQANFNLTKFLGTWYEIEWLPGEPHAEADIWRDFVQSFQLENGSNVRLSVPGKFRLLNNDTCFSFGPWSIVANNSAKMVLERKSPTSPKPNNWPYYVIKTDYDNYALIYGCSVDGYNLTEPCTAPIIWLFGRKVILADGYRKDMDNYIANTLCVNLTRMEITPHGATTCSNQPLSGSSSLSLNVLLFFAAVFILFT